MPRTGLPTCDASRSIASMGLYRPRYHWDITSCSIMHVVQQSEWHVRRCTANGQLSAAGRGMRMHANEAARRLVYATAAAASSTSPLARLDALRSMVQVAGHAAARLLHSTQHGNAEQMASGLQPGGECSTLLQQHTCRMQPQPGTAEGTPCSQQQDSNRQPEMQLMAPSVHT